MRADLRIRQDKVNISWQFVQTFTFCNYGIPFTFSGISSIFFFPCQFFYCVKSNLFLVFTLVVLKSLFFLLIKRVSCSFFWLFLFFFLFQKKKKLAIFFSTHVFETFWEFIFLYFQNPFLTWNVFNVWFDE